MVLQSKSNDCKNTLSILKNHYHKAFYIKRAG
nr:MAG TPA: hypothetical protein [Bacteriophage sp.]